MIKKEKQDEIISNVIFWAKNKFDLYACDMRFLPGNIPELYVYPSLDEHEKDYKVLHIRVNDKKTHLDEWMQDVYCSDNESEIKQYIAENIESI